MIDECGLIAYLRLRLGSILIDFSIFILPEGHFRRAFAAMIDDLLIRMSTEQFGQFGQEYESYAAGHRCNEAFRFDNTNTRHVSRKFLPTVR